MPNSAFLIVDDQKSIAQLLKQKLSELTNTPIFICHSLAEVKSRIANPDIKIEVCLCDLNLPDAPNGETIDVLIEHRITPVVLSGTFNENTRQQLVKKAIADFVVKDSPASIDYAVQALVNLHRNAKRKILLIGAEDSSYRSRLAKLIPSQRYQLEVTNRLPDLERLQQADLPSMILIENASRIDEHAVMAFIAQSRQKFDSHHLPIMACEPVANLAKAIKMMKYGVNDFIQTPANPEEIYVRLRQNIELSESYKEVEFFSQIDPLTELYNRRQFFKIGTQRFAQSQQKQDFTYTIMFDIDHFKYVNDSYGHQKGDDVIRYTAQMINALFDTEITGRFGGEEFCVFGNLENSPDLEQKIIQKTQNLLKTIETQSDIDVGLSFTLSAGLCFYGKSLNQAINSADKALYQSKSQGRNRLTLAK